MMDRHGNLSASGRGTRAALGSSHRGSFAVEPSVTQNRAEKHTVEVRGRRVHINGRLIRIGHLDGDGYELLDPRIVIEEIRRSPARIDLFTFMQVLPQSTPRYDYPVMLWDNLAAVPISTFDHWWARQINGKTRNMVRRAEKTGVVTREVPFDDTLVEGIHEIYNEIAFRQGKPFAHRGKDVDTVRRMSSTFLERSVFIGAFYEEKLIGFAKLVSDENCGQANIMHIISMTSHKDRSPNNALIAQAVRSCANRRIPYLVYAKFSYGRKERDSLVDFKESNGFQRVEIPRYYVAITLRGRVALRMGMHRRFADRIPEPLLARLRAIRRVWYVRRLGLAREQS